jgi:hypothetical protein
MKIPWRVRTLRFGGRHVEAASEIADASEAAAAVGPGDAFLEMASAYTRSELDGFRSRQRVEDEKKLSLAQVVSELLASPECPPDCGKHEFGVREAGEWHPPDPYE